MNATAQLGLGLSDDACYVCGQPAERWCDGYPPWKRGDPLLSVERMMEIMDTQTCSRPMCLSHVVRSTNMFFDGTPEVTGMETWDLCGDCLERKDGWRRPPRLELS